MQTPATSHPPALRTSTAGLPASVLPLASNAFRILPLHGLTLLAVEDSRFASDALRLICQRAGARLRRAETIAAARAHLRTYRPDVVIVDLGLPDGRGEALIRDLVLSKARPCVVLGTSGSATGRQNALAAGADGFLDKPLQSLSQFCEAVRRHLPELTSAPPIGMEDTITPDPLALQDDLLRAAHVLGDNPDPVRQRYVTGFVAGLARQSQDPALAAASLQAAEAADLTPLRGLIDQRLTAPDAAFPAAKTILR